MVAVGLVSIHLSPLSLDSFAESSQTSKCFATELFLELVLIRRQDVCVSWFAKDEVAAVTQIEDCNLPACKVIHSSFLD
jgi:hypothetical protein